MKSGRLAIVVVLIISLLAAGATRHWTDQLRTRGGMVTEGAGSSFSSMNSFALALLPGAHAQSVTGQISGAVADAHGAPIAGAAVRLVHDLSKQIRTFATDSDGNFLFTNLVPGDYSVHIEHPGFKGYDQRAIGGKSETVGRLS